jgi:predicted ATPase/DNA-binding SARP family transcriptional activator
MTTISHDPTTSGRLPVQLTRFIGREREIAELGRLAASTRLVTLTGAGGSGKTRLAWEVASRLSDAFSEICWVDLAPIADPALVAQHVASTLEIPDRPGQDAASTIVEQLQSRSMLLVLDNCEHVVDACSELVEAILRRCPGVRVLATSREALGVPGETAWLVPPLDSREAAALFVERAQGVLPTFSLTDANGTSVSEICRRLDGMPLAIELAAARVRVLTPDQIASRLSDAFRLLNAGSRTALPRHRTLRGTMDWSYALLNAREQVLLRRLAVFTGTFSLAAVEAICGDEPLEIDDLLDGVAALVEKSLIIMENNEGEARYRLLETVRQYGVERLRAAGEEDRLRERHAAHFVGFAELAEPHLFGGAAERSWVSRVTDDIGNLRAVAEWSGKDAARAAIGLRLGAAIHWYWFATGHFQEGRRRLSDALALGGTIDERVRARALIAMGHFAIWQGQPDGALPAMDEAADLARRFDDPFTLAYALDGIGAARFLQGDLAGAAVPLDESLGILRRLPPHVLRAIALYWRGQVAMHLEEFDLARALFEEALGVGRLLGHGPAMAHPLLMLGRLAFAQRSYGEAFERFAEALDIHHANDDSYGIVQGLEGSAAVAVVQGRFERGVRLFAAAEAIRAPLVLALSPVERGIREPLVVAARESLGTRFDAAWIAGTRMSRQDAVRLALAESVGLTGEFRAAPASSVDEAPPVPAPAVPALTVRALGALQVLRHGTPIDPTAWGSARPRELLVYLLVHPDGCTKEQVGLAFWPDASAAQVRNSFHVTLHRLRKALGTSEWITLAGERYRLDPAVTLEFDASSFESEVAAALRAMKRKEPGAPATLERALERYHGDFMDGEPAGDWHLELRDRLQRLYIDGLTALGELQMAEERWSKAADSFRRVLARDELHEQAWRRLMSCHARLGERSQALRLYQRLTELLKKELDAEPDEETRELIAEIQRA